MEEDEKLEKRRKKKTYADDTTLIVEIPSPGFKSEEHGEKMKNKNVKKRLMTIDGRTKLTNSTSK